MAIKSDRDGKCYDCGTEWKIGDEISANGHKTKAGKDYWCKMGKNCQGVMQVTGSAKVQLGTKGMNFKSMMDKPKDPTPEQFLEIAKKLLTKDTDIKDINVFVEETAKVTRRAAAKTAVRWASIIGVMDEIGLQHPSRIAFIKDVLN